MQQTRLKILEIEMLRAYKRIEEKHVYRSEIEMLRAEISRNHKAGAELIFRDLKL